jgi:hypothetical protein
MNGTKFLSGDGKVVIRLNIGNEVVIKMTLKRGRVTILLGGERFSSEGDREASKVVGETKLAKEAGCILLGENGLFIDGSDKSSNKTASSGTRGATDTEGTGFVEDFRDIDARRKLVGFELESKERRIASDRDDFVRLIEERASHKSEGGRSEIFGVSRNRSALLNALEMHDIGRDERGAGRSFMPSSKRA